MERNRWMVVATGTPKISPSGLTFLWDECPGCYYEEVKLGVRRPSRPMASIFNRIDRAQKAYYQGRTLRTPDGIKARVYDPGTEWAKSDRIILPSGACYISGKFDTILTLEDGSYAVGDFKTAAVKPDNLAKYERQLGAYALALEKPA